MSSNVTVTGPQYGFESVIELAALKRQGTEYVALSASDDEQHRGRLDELETALQAACDESALPQQPPNKAECEAWLVALRRAEL